MSKVEEATTLHNNKSAEDRFNATLEHMAEMERQRKVSEDAVNNSVKSNWEHLREKRKSPKVLQRFPL